MNLRQLEVFYAIMQAGTVSGAARLLHVSQPNVTRVLAHTEQQLSFALFERVKGRLVPTQEAKALLPEAEKSLSTTRTISLSDQQSQTGNSTFTSRCSACFGRTLVSADCRVAVERARHLL